MKPEIIFIEEYAGEVRISKERLKELIDKAYEQGKKDVQDVVTVPWTSNPSINFGDGAVYTHEPVKIMATGETK